MKAESLLARVKSGHSLTSHEIDFVRRALTDKMSDEDPYTLIHVLWKSEDRASRELIAPFLHGDDEMVRRIALQTLTALFPTEEMFDLAVASVNDASKQVRMAGATAVGRLGASLPRRRSEAARLLLERFEQQRGDVEWEAYYEGLLDLTQTPMNRRPLATRALRAGDIDAAVITAARALL